MQRKWETNDTHGVVMTRFYHSLDEHSSGTYPIAGTPGSREPAMRSPSPGVWVLVGYKVAGHGYSSDGHTNLAAARIFYLKI